MKYSGVEWIGIIPDNWEVRKVKHCFYLSKEKAKQENPTILSLARDSVKVRDISNNEGQLAESYFDYNPVKYGDLLLNPMDLYSGANCNMSEVEGVISPAYANLRAKVDLSPKFYDYYFKTQYWAMAMFAHGKGVSFDNRWTINNETLFAYKLPWVDKNYQDNVVLYLNEKLKQIDLLIENENEQIEKLKEYKQAIITDAVTKGIDKNVEYKDSGVEWIGCIPSDWTLNRVKYCTTYNDSQLSDKTNRLLQINYVDIGSVSLENGIEKIEEITFENAPSRARRITKINDVIVSTVRTYLKAITVIDKENLIVSTGFCVLRPNKIIEPRYLSYYCKSNCFCDFITANSYGVNYPGISAEKLVVAYLPYPNIKEQFKIANYLDKKVSDIQKLLNIKNCKIEKLYKYKKSLIFEYVTGKKELLCQK